MIQKCALFIIIIYLIIIIGVFFCEYYFHILSYVSFKGNLNKQAVTSPQATTLLILHFKFLFAFL